MALLDKLKALGVDRSALPENINEFFGDVRQRTQRMSLKRVVILRGTVR